MTDESMIDRRKEIQIAVSAASRLLESEIARIVGAVDLDQDARAQRLVDGFQTYVDTYRDALELFGRGDEIVARWLCVEMFGAFAQALASLRSAGTPSPTLKNVPMPRLELLDSWFRGGTAPAYLTEQWTTSFDTLRHDVVPPHTEFPGGMPLPRWFFEEPPD